MNAPRSFASIEDARPFLTKPLYLAIGMFDGVHAGHRAVVCGAIQAARASGGLSAVLTFWPHPSRLFKPDFPVRLLQTPPDRERRLFELGADAVITQPFTQEFASIRAEDMLPFLKNALPTLAAVHVGENWRFGRGRAGDVPLLQSEGRKLGLKIVSTPRVSTNGEPVSSTRIRSLLAQGEIREVNALLGYRYFSEGVVVPGKKLGRLLGFPTLNLAWKPDLAPGFGVYVVRIRSLRVENSPWLPAVANYGLRPTVEQTTEPRLEVHVLGACDLVEGDEVRVEWLSFLRPEMQFSDVGELKTQIASDRDRASAYFSKWGA